MGVDDAGASTAVGGGVEVGSLVTVAGSAVAVLTEATGVTVGEGVVVGSKIGVRVGEAGIGVGGNGIGATAACCT